MSVALNFLPTLHRTAEGGHVILPPCADLYPVLHGRHGGTVSDLDPMPGTRPLIPGSKHSCADGLCFSRAERDILIMGLHSVLALQDPVFPFQKVIRLRDTVLPISRGSGGWLSETGKSLDGNLNAISTRLSAYPRCCCTPYWQAYHLSY